MISIIVYQMLIIFNDYNLQPYKIKIKINIILNKHGYFKN